MAQHDYTIANQTFPNTRTDINNALSAIVSQNSGASAPSTTYAYQLWYDTTNDILKQRNADDDAWIDLFDVDQTADTATPSAGGGGGGKVLQFASDQSANTSSGTTIPQDSTAPTNTEGAEVFSIAFTPTASDSTLLLQASFQLSSNSNARYAVWALFEDSTCIGAWSGHIDYSNNGMVASFNVVRSASSTSARTYSVRAGVTSGTIYIGDIYSNNYGGLNANYMTIQEMGA